METNTFFLHINNRFPGQEAFLSDFLTGSGFGGPSIVTDPIDSFTQREFFDLRDRKDNLACLIIRCDIQSPPVNEPLNSEMTGQ